MDDLSLYVPIRLQDNLRQDTREPLIGPVSYHNRTGQILPEYFLFIGVYFLVFVAVNGVYPLLMSLKSNKM